MHVTTVIIVVIVKFKSVNGLFGLILVGDKATQGIVWLLFSIYTTQVPKQFRLINLIEFM